MFIISLTFHPEGFSDNSPLISANVSSDTSAGLPLLGRSFNPSHLLVEIIVLIILCCNINAINGE
jgi:hypothetical protein